VKEDCRFNLSLSIVSNFTNIEEIASRLKNQSKTKFKEQIQPTEL